MGRDCQDHWHEPGRVGGAVSFTEGPTADNSMDNNDAGGDDVLSSALATSMSYLV